MGRIHGVFHDLQPIARIEIFLARDEAVARPDKAVVHRQRWLLVGRAQIREDDAVVLPGGIRSVAQPVLQSAVRRLAGCFKDGAIGREQPSVIAAAYSLGVDQPKLQRCAAMGTMQLQQTHGAAQVAEHHQFFAENFHSLRQITQFVGEADRLPKAAQVFAARRAGSNMGELAVLAGDVTMEVAAKSRLQEGGSGGHCGPPFNYWIDSSLLNSSRRPGRWSDGSAGTRGRVAGTDCFWRGGPGTPDSFHSAIPEAR